MMAKEKLKYPIGKHPNSLANLRPLKKGDKSRNPNGRPTKEKSITEAVRVFLKGTLKDLKPKPDDPLSMVLAKDWINHARIKAPYFEMLLERIEGKIIQPIGGDPNMPLVINVDRILAHLVEENGDATGSSSKT